MSTAHTWVSERRLSASTAIVKGQCGRASRCSVHQCVYCLLLLRLPMAQLSLSKHLEWQPGVCLGGVTQRFSMSVIFACISCFFYKTDTVYCFHENKECGVPVFIHTVWTLLNSLDHFLNWFIYLLISPEQVIMSEFLCTVGLFEVIQMISWLYQLTITLFWRMFRDFCLCYIIDMHPIFLSKLFLFKGRYPHHIFHNFIVYLFDIHFSFVYLLWCVYNY